MVGMDRNCSFLTHLNFCLPGSSATQYANYQATDELGRFNQDLPLVWTSDKTNILSVLRDPQQIQNISDQMFGDIMVAFKIGDAMVDRQSHEALLHFITTANIDFLYRTVIAWAVK